MSEEKVILRFRGNYNRYCAGDVAGFDPERAQRITSIKIIEQDRDGNTSGREVPIAYKLNASEIRALKKDKEEDTLSRPNKPVRFTRKYGPYNPGEVAGFDPDLAKKLIRGWKSRSGPVPPVAVEFVADEKHELSKEEFIAAKPQRKRKTRKKAPAKAKQTRKRKPRTDGDEGGAAS